MEKIRVVFHNNNFDIYDLVNEGILPAYNNRSRE